MKVSINMDALNLVNKTNISISNSDNTGKDKKQVSFNDLLKNTKEKVVVKSTNENVPKDTSVNSISKDIKNEKASLDKDNADTKVVKKEDGNVKNPNTENKDAGAKTEDIINDLSEEDIKNLNEEQLLEVINCIANLLNEIKISPDMNIEEMNFEGINIVDKINSMIQNLSSEVIKAMPLDSVAISDNPINIVTNLMEALKSENVNDLLGEEGLTKVQSILKELGAKLENTSDINLQGDSKSLKEAVKLVEVEVAALLKSYKVSDDSSIKNDLSLKGNVVIAPKEDSEIKASNNDDFQDSLDGNKEGKDAKSSSTEKIAKEENVLKSILKDGEDKDDSFSKMINRLAPSTLNNTTTTTSTGVNGDVQVITKENMSGDLVRTVKFMVNNNTKEMIVKLNPEHLGEMTIKVTEEHGVLKANIKASSKETYALLSQNINDIKKQLGEHNIKIQEVEISVYEDDTTFYKDGHLSQHSSQENKGKGPQRNFFNDGNIIEEEPIDEIKDDSNINMLA